MRCSWKFPEISNSYAMSLGYPFLMQCPWNIPFLCDVPGISLSYAMSLEYPFLMRCPWNIPFLCNVPGISLFYAMSLEYPLLMRCPNKVPLPHLAEQKKAKRCVCFYFEMFLCFLAADQYRNSKFDGILLKGSRCDLETVSFVTVPLKKYCSERVLKINRQRWPTGLSYRVLCSTKMT